MMSYVSNNNVAWQQEEKNDGKKKYRLTVDQPDYLPVKDIEIFLTDAKNSEIGVRLGRVCFGHSY